MIFWREHGNSWNVIICFPRRCLLFPGKSHHYMNTKKMSHTDCIDLIQWQTAKTDKLPSVDDTNALYAAQTSSDWNLKKTKSSRLSKLEEKFIHNDCLEVQTVIGNLCLPWAQQSIILDAIIIRLTWITSSLKGSPSVQSGTIVLKDVFSTRGSCSSSQEPRKKHLCCEKNLSSTRLWRVEPVTPFCNLNRAGTWSF